MSSIFSREIKLKTDQILQNHDIFTDFFNVF